MDLEWIWSGCPRIWNGSGKMLSPYQSLAMMVSSSLDKGGAKLGKAACQDWTRLAAGGWARLAASQRKCTPTH